MAVPVQNNPLHTTRLTHFKAVRRSILNEKCGASGTIVSGE